MSSVGSDAPKLQCPGCETRMHSMTVDGNEVRFCENCHGILVERQSILKGYGRDSLGTVLRHGEERLRSQERHCPFCSGTFREWQPAGEPALAIDVCGNCESLYLDRGEYPKITKYLRSTRRKRLSSPPKPQGMGTTVSASGETGSVLFQFVTHLPLEVGVSQKILSPGVTALIILNVLVFIITASGNLDYWVSQFGLVPSRIVAGAGYVTLLSSMFMHADILHLLGNMYFLFVAGDNVEDAMGTPLFLGSYLGFGFVASFAQIASDSHSAIPCIGASGAISGVLGSYLVLHPTRRFLYRFFYLAWLNIPLHVPVVVYFGLWFVMQLAFSAMGIPGVAWHAHIGGFLAGIGFTLVTRLGGITLPKEETT